MGNFTSTGGPTHRAQTQSGEVTLTVVVPRAWTMRTKACPAGRVPQDGPLHEVLPGAAGALDAGADARAGGAGHRPPRHPHAAGLCGHAEAQLCAGEGPRGALRGAGHSGDPLGQGAAIPSSQSWTAFPVSLHSVLRTMPSHANSTGQDGTKRTLETSLTSLSCLASRPERKAVAFWRWFLRVIGLPIFCSNMMYSPSQKWILQV